VAAAQRRWGNYKTGRMKGRSMEKADVPGSVSIRRYSDSSECDVVVTIRDREMIVRLPNYSRAVKWAQLESKSYKLPAIFSEE
jgi:hypothetical protein